MATTSRLRRPSPRMPPAISWWRTRGTTSTGLRIGCSSGPHPTAFPGATRCSSMTRGTATSRRSWRDQPPGTSAWRGRTTETRRAGIAADSGVGTRGTREASELTRFHAGPSRLRTLDLGEPLPDFLDRIRIFEGRRVADLLTGDERADHTAHDLPASGLRQFPCDVDFVRHGDGPDLFPNVIA